MSVFLRITVSSDFAPEPAAKYSPVSALTLQMEIALNRQSKTPPYLDHGFLELDNNTAERAMKPVVIDRKDWMFTGS